MKITTSNSRRDVLALGFGAAAMAGASAFGAEASFDFVIKGGRIIDPAQGMNAIGDVAIAGGRIAAIAPTIAPGGAYVLDAANKLVVPGFVDIHTHCTGFPRGAALELRDGVTSWIDAGHKGADNIEGGIGLARAAPQTAALLVNIGRHGMGGGDFKPDMQSVADVAACRAAIEAHRDIIVGVKARLSKEIAGENDLEILRRAEEATTPYGLPVMIHIGNCFSPLGKILNLLKRGDIVTHILAPPPNNIFAANGKIIPEVAAAHARGVKFDVGHGRAGHWGWDLAEKAMQQGLVPDTTSTDWTQQGHDEGRLSMPEMITNLLAVGVPLERAIAMGTINAASCFPVFSGRGTLRPGAPADVALLELKQGEFVLQDSLTPINKRTYTQRLVPVGTVIGGKLMYQA